MPRFVRPIVLRPWLRRAALAVVVLLGLRAVWIVGHVVWWRFQDVGETAFMEDRLDDLEARARSKSGRPPTLAHKNVPWSSISPHLLRAVIAAEDARFRHHLGFDLDGIVDAAEKNVKARRLKAGGSTISQQLAKNLFLSPRRSFVRKGEEALITITLELLWDKRRILEVYVNVIEWGDGVFGAEAAARHYFDVSASSLTPEQAAWLAAIIPSPRRYDRDRDNAKVGTKAARIRAQMDALELP